MPVIALDVVKTWRNSSDSPPLISSTMLFSALQAHRGEVGVQRLAGRQPVEAERQRVVDHGPGRRREPACR